MVFDLDGTLIDSRRDLAESANALLEECGCTPHSEEAIGRMVGNGAATLVKRAFDRSHCEQPPHALARFLEIYNARLLRHTRPYDGVEEVLTDLEPQLRLAVLTNKPLNATREILEGLSLTRFFGDRILGGDGPLPRKPDPSGLVHLISEAGGAPATTLMVGDSFVDWQTARSARARPCVARYGFGFAGFPIEELSDEDLVIDHPSELSSHL